MLTLRTSAPTRSRDEGERPYWISFSDLMSALMVLFLVAMSVALLAVTKKVSEAEREDRERTEAIKALMEDISRIASEFEGVRVDLDSKTIDFGREVTFEREGQNTFTVEQKRLLREFTPRLVNKLRDSPAAQKWFKRTLVEGYASRTGKYLFNLNLSLERSERVLCELLRGAMPGEIPIAEADRRLIAEKFFVGGASFNSLRETAEQSRRVEFKLEFKSLVEKRDEEKRKDSEIEATEEQVQWLSAALDARERCPIADR
jgi:outer membrane protein OmpA-like peptidoglycan-associated protein